MAASPALPIRVGAPTAYPKLHDRRWIDRPPVSLIPNATPEDTVRRIKITQGRRK